jgi:hypothetical protein
MKRSREQGPRRKKMEFHIERRACPKCGEDRCEAREFTGHMAGFVKHFSGIFERCQNCGTIFLSFFP